MKKLYCLPLLAAITLSLAACTEELSPSGEDAAPETVLQETNPFVPGVVTVQFDEETTLRIERALAEGETVLTRSPQLDPVLEALGIKSLRRVFPDAGPFEPRTRKEGLHRFYYVEFDSACPVTRAAGELSELEGIVSVSPQLPVRPRTTFNDPYFSSQWHLKNGRYKDADINVEKVWDEFTVGNRDVIVSVVDEGVLMTHEDLTTNLIPCLEDGSGSYNFNNDTPTVVPYQGHGTHVAGVITAINNNGTGVCGVAGGDAAKGIPGVRVMSCQIFDLYGTQPDLFEAIKHGADHGAVILQCSWGFSPDLDGDGVTTQAEIDLYRSYSINDLPEYKAAIDYFIKYAGCDNDGNQLPDAPMKGGVVVFAAGNDNFDYDPLVSYEPIIAVGAFGATGNKASYSNYGDWVDIAAPGGDAKQGIYSTILSNSYGGTDWQGTSMACPHVSGVAALLVSYFGGPGFTAEECRTRLVRGAVPNFFSGSRYIGRKLDAYGAFTFDPSTPVREPVLSWSGDVPETVGYRAQVEVPFTVSDPSGQRIFLSLASAVQGVTLLEDTASGGGRIRIDGTEAGTGAHSVTLRAVNEDRAEASLSFTFQVLENRPPVQVNAEIPSGIVLNAPGSSRAFPLSPWFSDPDQDALAYEASLSDPTLASLSVSDAGELTVQALQAGHGSLSVVASDGDKETHVTVPFAVRNPEAPASVSPAVATREITVAVDALTSVPVSVEVFSATGARVLSTKKEGDIFSPIVLSVKDLAPGRYTVHVSWEGEQQTLRFAKV